MYAKTDKPDHLYKLTATQNVKVDKSQCSLRPKQCSLKLTTMIVVSISAINLINVNPNMNTSYDVNASYDVNTSCIQDQEYTHQREVRIALLLGKILARELLWHVALSQFKATYLAASR